VQPCCTSRCCRRAAGRGECARCSGTTTWWCGWVGARQRQAGGVVRRTRFHALLCSAAAGARHAVCSPARCWPSAPCRLRAPRCQGGRWCATAAAVVPAGRRTAQRRQTPPRAQLLRRSQHTGSGARRLHVVFGWQAGGACASLCSPLLPVRLRRCRCRCRSSRRARRPPPCCIGLKLRTPPPSSH
jgi:hypothetical protein